ncbi:MAG: LPS export ABC transporter periplasmic protein LptC [Nitrospirae bacterium]|nr:LPS export ABC transporter periplasmic protein LptC [Nitrospirota bacterium]
MDISRKWKYIGIICFLLFVVILTGLLKGKEEGKGERLETAVLGDIVQRIENFHLIRFKGEDVEWEIAAKKAVIHNGEDDASLQEIGITHNPYNGEPIRLTAERGRYNIDSNAFLLEKVEREVDVKIGEGLTINVGSLSWSEDDREIWGPGKVLLVGQRFILEGEDLIANLDKGVYEIKNNIRAAMW